MRRLLIFFPHFGEGRKLFPLPRLGGEGFDGRLKTVNGECNGVVYAGSRFASGVHGI
jgi:hypothetical protein